MMEGLRSQRSPRPDIKAIGEFIPLSTFADSIDPDTTVQLSVLCTTCTKFASRIRSLWLEELDASRIEQIYTRSQLRSGNRQDCHLCTLLWHEICWFSDALLKEAGSYVISFVGHTISDVATTSNYVLGLPKARSIEINAHSELKGNGAMWQRERCVLYLDHDVKACSSILTMTTKSRSSWEQAVKWLDQCHQSHKSCRIKTSKKPFQPTRLIDVGQTEGGNSLRLAAMAEDDFHDRYIALSYRWGASPGLRLTCTTFDQFRLSMPYESLPKTIQDAILITRKLGVRWLWVDALCILQDSKDDWKREAALMSDTYQNSFLTIAALGANDSNDGLFAVRDPLLYSHCQLFHDTDGRPVHVHATKWSPLWSIDRAPLNKRAWVVQERLLSPRTLYFGSTMSFECREAMYEESLRESLNTKKDFFWEWLSEHSILDKHTDWKQRDFWFQWSQILGLYTRSSLTVQTDRPVALLGIIQTISEVTGLKYVSGLWGEWVLESLLWQRSETAHNPNKLDLNSRLDGPSWSWEYLTGEVEYGVHWHYDGEGRTDIATVLEVDISKRHKKLSILGHMIEVEILSQDLQWICRGLWTDIFPTPQEGRAFDFSFRGPGQKIYYLPLLCHATPRGRYEVDGLLLEESVSIVDGYHRVGCGIISGILPEEVDKEASSAATWSKLLAHAAQTQTVDIF